MARRTTAKFHGNTGTSSIVPAAKLGTSIALEREPPRPSMTRTPIHPMRKLLLTSLITCVGFAACADHNGSLAALDNGPQAPINDPDDGVFQPGPDAGGSAGAGDALTDDPLTDATGGGTGGSGDAGGAQQGGGTGSAQDGGSGGGTSQEGGSQPPTEGGGQPVPEPGTLLLVGSGLAAAALLRRRRKPLEA